VNASSVFTYAARHLGHAGTNPVSLLDRVERPSSDDEKPKRILTGEELAHLLGALDDGYRALFDVAAETGARLAETLGLIWEEVDLDAETVTFTHQLDRKGQRQRLKTKRSRRCLEVTPGLVSKLRAYKLASPCSSPHDLVFASRAGTGLDHRNIGGRVLARAVQRAGLEAIEDRHGVVVQPAPTFHALPHSHASALIAAGWDIEEVSARLGHTSVATTQRSTSTSSTRRGGRGTAATAWQLCTAWRLLPRKRTRFVDAAEHRCRWHICLAREALWRCVATSRRGSVCLG